MLKQPNRWNCASSPKNINFPSRTIKLLARQEVQPPCFLLIGTQTPVHWHPELPIKWYASIYFVSLAEERCSSICPEKTTENSIQMAGALWFQVGVNSFKVRKTSVQFGAVPKLTVSLYIICVLCFLANSRIPVHLLASHWIIATIVIFLVLRSTPTHVNGVDGYSEVAPIFLVHHVYCGCILGTAS